VRFPKYLPVVVACCLAVAACSSSPKKPQAKPGVTGTTAIEITLKQIGAADLVSSARGVRPLDEGTSKAVLASVQQLFDATVLDPLTKGQAGSIDRVMTNDAVRQATGVDRAAMYDEDLPRVTHVEAPTALVQVTGLAGDNDAPALVIAKFAWDVTGDGGAVHIVRSGELSLIPVLGTWLIGAYNVANSRVVNGTTTTSTAVKK